MLGALFAVHGLPSWQGEEPRYQVVGAKVFAACFSAEFLVKILAMVRG